MSGAESATAGIDAPPRLVPLDAVHHALRASMMAFAGWSMPVRYESDLAEHRAVRENAGLFDVSHMGRIELTGPDAASVLDRALVSRTNDLVVGRARYTMLCDEDGQVIDDLIVTRLDEFDLIVANAANTDTVLAALRDVAQGHDVAIDLRPGHVLLALQGPAAAEVLGSATTDDRATGAPDATALRPFRAVATRVAGVATVVSRTGYTGEDGFELACADAAGGRRVWDALLDAGAAHGVVPCGLAARDTLRLEAGLPLHGRELGPATGLGPFETGFGRIVHLDADREFPGRLALERIAIVGPARTLVGLVAEGRRAPRAGHPVAVDGRHVGAVTSGAPSPTLGVPVALAAVERGSVVTGDTVSIDVRGTAVPARVVDLPFVPPASHRGS